MISGNWKRATQLDLQTPRAPRTLVYLVPRTMSTSCTFRTYSREKAFFPFCLVIPRSYLWGLKHNQASHLALAWALLKQDLASLVEAVFAGFMGMSKGI